MAYLEAISRRSVANALQTIILLAGWAAVAMSVPVFVRRVPAAPPEFWILVLIALLIELVPLVIPHKRKQSTQLAASLSLTFGMLLLWGPAVAIVVQTLALGVAQLRLRRSLTDSFSTRPDSASRSWPQGGPTTGPGTSCPVTSMTSTATRSPSSTACGGSAAPWSASWPGSR